MSIEWDQGHAVSLSYRRGPGQSSARITGPSGAVVRAEGRTYNKSVPVGALGNRPRFIRQAVENIDTRIPPSIRRALPGFLDLLGPSCESRVLDRRWRTEAGI